MEKKNIDPAIVDKINKNVLEIRPPETQDINNIKSGKVPSVDIGNLPLNNNNNDYGASDEVNGLKEQIKALKKLIEKLEEECRRKDLDNFKMIEAGDSYKKRIKDLEDMKGDFTQKGLIEENQKLKDLVNDKEDEIEMLKEE